LYEAMCARDTSCLLKVVCSFVLWKEAAATF